MAAAVVVAAVAAAAAVAALDTMKIVKPLRLMALPRPYRWRNSTHLAVTIAALVEDAGKGPRLLPEYALVHEVLPELDADEVLDFVMPKPRPEYLVSGYAYTNHQEEKTSCMVSVRVDDKRKDGLVFGDRYWIENSITKPAPFERMPLNWSNSFGGPGYPDNPLGTGLDEIEVEPGVHAVRLPNLESPIQRIQDRGQRVVPFNFGQIRIDWPQRASKMGTFDQAWVENVGTGFFDDMQPSLFNAAADDQVWTDRTALRMDESFEIWNMHPDKECWSGELPPVKARAFIERRGHKGQLDEIDMRATTVWFLPHRCSYVLLFHGTIPIEDDDAYDVTGLLAGLERIGKPRDADHYQQVFQTRCDHEKAALHAIRDEELMPADLLAPWLEEMPLDSNAMLSKISRAMAGGHENPFLGGFVGPVKPMLLSDLPDMIERSERELQDSLDEYERERQRMLSGEDTGIGGRKESEFENKLRREIYEQVDFSRKGARPRIPRSGPPDIADSFGVQEAEQRRLMRRVIADTPEGVFPSLGAAYDFTRQSLRKLYLYSVHFQDGVARVGEHRAITLRKRVQARYDKGRNLSGMDLTGADLSGMVLDGADFSEAWLEGASLADCSLKGAVFRATVLARADFSGAILDQARIQEANISEARFDRTSFSGTLISEIIARAPVVFRQCRFENATLSDFDAEDTTIDSCTVQGGVMRGVQWTRGVLRNCRFEGSLLDKMDLDDGLLEDVTMLDCELLNCDFDQTNIVRWELEKCQVKRLTVDEGMLVEQPVISHCHFTQSLFREARFVGAHFTDTVLEQCDFSLANLELCRMERVQTPQSIFVRTNFDRANLSGSNLMHGNFQKARFVGANLARCNFFRADMSETLVDASTIVDQAYIQHTRLVPKRRDLAV